MYSFNFPSMLGSTTSNLLKDKDSIRSNLLLLLSIEKNSLFGDPELGSTLRQILFEQGTSVIADLLIDEVYSAIISFIPQIYIERKNIKIITVGQSLVLTLSYIYKLDNTSDLYAIRLTDNETL